MKAGKHADKDVFWHYSGHLISVHTGNPLASIEGIERTSPLQSYPTSMPLAGLNATELKMGYFTEKTFVYTDIGVSLDGFYE